MRDGSTPLLPNNIPHVCDRCRKRLYLHVEWVNGKMAFFSGVCDCRVWNYKDGQPVYRDTVRYRFVSWLKKIGLIKVA